MIRGTTRYQSFTIQLSAAQVRSLFTTPVMLLNSPGDERYTHLIRLDAWLLPGNIAYTTAGPLEVTYGLSGSAALVYPATLVNGSLELTTAVPPDNPDPIEDYINQPVYLQASSAIAGNGTGRLVVTGTFVLFKVDMLTPFNLFDYSILDYSVSDYSITDQGT